MGVDIETYRGRIGTFKFASGVDVIILQCTLNFSGCLKAVGSLVFIGILLLMAGIEQNPGPTEQPGNSSAETNSVVIYIRKDLNQPLYKNWVRAATGFRYLKSGLQTFISRQLQEQHTDILRKIGPAAVKCTSCTADNLLPEHHTRFCAQKYRNKCFCKDHHSRRKCPQNFCSKFYDKIIASHAEANPLWFNVDTTRWYDNFFEFAKCFVSTTGYREQHSVTEMDALGLLSIAINDLYIHDAIDKLDLFKMARESRHEIFHTKSYEVTDDQLNTYIEEMIDVLQDTKCLASYPDAQQAVEELKRLKTNQIYISEEDASAVMDIALEAIKESKHEAISEIENARDSAVHDIDSRQERKKNDANTKRQELRAHIIEHYERYYSTIDVSPLVRNKDIDIDELYTPLIILNKEQTERFEKQKWRFKGTRITLFFDDDEYSDYFIRVVNRYQHYNKFDDSFIREFNRLHRKAVFKNGMEPRIFFEVYEEYFNWFFRKDFRYRLYDQDPILEKFISFVRNAFFNNGNIEQGNMGKSIVSLVYDENIDYFFRKFSHNEYDDIFIRDFSRFNRTAFLYFENMKSNTIFLEYHKYVICFIGEVIRFHHKAFFSHGSLLRNVFLTGEAGFGKTTLCKKLLSVWCNIHKREELSKSAQISIGQDWNLDFFQFVFYICLRDTDKENSLEDMVKKQLLPPRYHDIFEEILEHEPDKCLFICDGLDEWNPPEDMPKYPTTSHGLPLRNSKSNYVALFTARSWKLDNIRPTSGEVDAMLTIQGIVSQRELIGKLLRLLDKTEYKQFTIDRFMLDVEKREKLRPMMKTPLVLKLIICLWYDKQMLSESLTCVYSDIIELFLRHAARRNKRDRDFQDDACHKYTCESDICPNFISKGRPYIQKESFLLLKLSKLAFETLFSKENHTKLIFKTSDLSRFGITDFELKILLKLGILSLHMVAGSSVLEEEKEVAFIHSTFQEYFAAFYVTSKNDIGVETILRQRYNCWQGIKNVETFLVFVSCLKPSTIHTIFTSAASIIKDHIKSNWHSHLISSSASDICNALLISLKEVNCAHDTDDKVILTDIIYSIRDSELLRNVDCKKTKSLTIEPSVLQTGNLASYLKQLETLRDFSSSLPIQETLHIMKSSQESLKYVFIKKRYGSLNNQILAGFRTLIQNMPQLKYVVLESVVYFKSMMGIDHFLKTCREYEHKLYRCCFHRVYCLPHSTKLEEDENCSMVIDTDDYLHQFTIDDSTHVTGLKNIIPIQCLTKLGSCPTILELVDVKMSLLSLKLLFEEVIFPDNYKDITEGHELPSSDNYKSTTLFTVKLILNVPEKIIHQLSASDVERQIHPEHLLSFSRSDYRIGNLKSSSHFSHLDMSRHHFICNIDCVNMDFPPMISILLWIVALPNTEIRMRLDKACCMKIPLGVSPTIRVKSYAILYSLTREIKPYLSQTYILEVCPKQFLRDISSLDFDRNKITCLILDRVTLTLKELIGILKSLKDSICIPYISMSFSEIICFGKGDVDSYLSNCPEISFESCEKFYGPTCVKKSVIIFKNILNEDISEVRQVLRLLNNWKGMLYQPFSIIGMKNLKIAQENLKELISGLKILCNEPVIELSKVALLDTNGERSENVIETCCQNWLPEIHVIDVNGMLSVFKEACMFRTLVCTTETNYNARHLMRLLPTCQCLEELRLLDININNMTFDFNSEMKSLQRIYLFRIKATSASLQTLLDTIPMSDQDVIVYLNNLFLVDESPQIFLDTVQKIRQIRVESFSKVKQVCHHNCFLFDDTEDDSQFFRMTVRKWLVKVSS